MIRFNSDYTEGCHTAILEKLVETNMEQLSQAMRLGKLGEQVVIKSQFAFSNLKFEGFSIAEKDKYYVQRKARNDEANQTYLKMLDDETDGIYMQDIMRGGIRSDDPRIPRNLSE